MSDQQRRMAFLQEMGLGPIWRSRALDSVVPSSVDMGEETAIVSDFAQQEQEFTHIVQIENSIVDAASAVALAMQEEAPAGHVVSDMTWSQLQETVSECTQCGLCQTRTQTVFGTGDSKARWLFVGEGPGRNEDAQGQPFVGPAGKLLDNMMGAMGLQRGMDTYIANIVKCRPTDANRRDRPPALDEVKACMPYLKKQIALINPTVIVTLGKTAALSLLELDPATPVSRLRGVQHRYGDIPVVVTYHPAYLLRNLPDKRKTWADLCLAMQIFTTRV